MGRTVVIVDYAHSGTTMLAGLCELFGIPMTLGEEIHPWKLEDHDMIYSIQGKGRPLADLVEERNGRPTWGFKFPGASAYLPLLQRTLRNPTYLAIYKDPVSVTRRRFGTSNRVIWKKLRNTVRQMERSISLIHASGLPVHMLSYYYAITRTEEFVRQVAGAVEVDLTADLLEEAITHITPNTGPVKKEYPKWQT